MVHKQVKSKRNLRSSSFESPTRSLTEYTGPNNVHVKYYAVDITSLGQEGLSSFDHYETDSLRDINFRARNGAFATSGRRDYVAALFESFLDFSESGTYQLCTIRYVDIRSSKNQCNFLLLTNICCTLN